MNFGSPWVESTVQKLDFKLSQINQNKQKSTDYVRKEAAQKVSDMACQKNKIKILTEDPPMPLYSDHLKPVQRLFSFGPETEKDCMV